MKIKLLFVIDNLEFGGGERVFSQIINGLTGKAYDIFLASNPGTEMYRSIDRSAVRCMPLDFSTRTNVPSLKALVRTIRKHRIDIVHGQGGRAEFYARLASKVAGSAKYVSTIAMPVEGYDVSALRRGIYCFFDRITEKCVDRFIVVSDFLKRRMIEGHGVPAEKVVRIYNGIETNRYDPASGADGSSRFRAGMGFRPEDRLVGAIGRMVWQKGFEYLIRGIPDVLKACPQARFLFVGDGPLRESLQALSSRLGSGGSVFFTGFQRDIRDILSALDLCVVPSLREGFPMVTLEAMAMARPIVATRIDGVTEQMTDGREGFLVPPEDPTALARAVSTVLLDRSLAQEMGRQARLTVERKFPVEKMIEETEGVYQSLVR